MAIELVEPVKRVEQYLYALCVLDFSNIPVPRSRLEIFTHALITGEIPEIAPETREEEYMVAIIKGDVANLPTPKSRADHLLYRICLGETEIRDIELETRYEMLLAYLAEHGDMPLETVLVECVKALQTIPNTVEMPVKSAILKGNTLVNLLDRNDIETNGLEYTFDNGVYTVISNRNWAKLIFNPTLDINKKYFITVSSSVSDAKIFYRTSDEEAKLIGSAPVNAFIFTTPSDKILNLSIEFPTAVTNGKVSYPMLFEYQEGMENWDIPYFEGMQSVKKPVLTTTGKNLFNIKDNTHVLTKLENGNYNVSPAIYLNLPKFKEKTSYTLSFSVSEKHDVTYQFPRIRYSDNTELISYRPNGTFNGNPAYILKSNSTKTISHIDFSYGNNDVYLEFVDFQIEEGSNSTSYEPYQSNILTVNEPVELRGIDEVQDTLDLKTGEVTERVGEFVLDGSEDWNKWGTDSFLYRGSIRVNETNSKILSDKLPVVDYGSIYNCTTYGIGSRYGNIGIRINNVASVGDLKMFLSQNPITVQYHLETESIKTVDLIIKDQDGNAVPCLSTFNDATHVSINTVDIIPQVDLEVRVDANTMANVASQQENVAVAQAALSDAIDSQSDEVETTMMALTEVYEGRNEE